MIIQIEPKDIKEIARINVKTLHMYIRSTADVREKVIEAILETGIEAFVTNRHLWHMQQQEKSAEVGTSYHKRLGDLYHEEHPGDSC